MSNDWVDYGQWSGDGTSKYERRIREEEKRRLAEEYEALKENQERGDIDVEELKQQGDMEKGDYLQAPYDFNQAMQIGGSLAEQDAEKNKVFDETINSVSPEGRYQRPPLENLREGVRIRQKEQNLNPAYHLGSLIETWDDQRTTALEGAQRTVTNLTGNETLGGVTRFAGEVLYPEAYELPLMGAAAAIPFDGPLGEATIYGAGALNRLRRGLKGVKASTLAKAGFSAKALRKIILGPNSINVKPGGRYSDEALELAGIGKLDIGDVDDFTSAKPLQMTGSGGGRITRSQAEPVTKELALNLQKRLGGTKQQALEFQAFQQKAGRDITEVIRALNALALKQEPKNIPEFMEAIEVALGTKVDYRDFIAKGKSITYNSAKGKQVIKDLNDLNVALLNRLEVVGGGGVRRSKGHYSLGHIRAVQNLIQQGDVGANRLSNMEPEVLRSILSLTNSNPNKIEEVVEILGNSARKNLRDKPSEILTAQNVSKTIEEEYLKFINPKDLGNYWSEILPKEHYRWFEDAVDAAVSEKIKFARKLKKVSTVEEGEQIISKMRSTAMDDALNALRPFADSLTEKRSFDLNAVILKEAPEIILDHIELIKNKIQWVPPKPGSKDWKTMKNILAKNNLSIDDVDTALRTGWRIQEGTSSLKTPLPKLKSKTIAASELSISEIEARLNAGWNIDFTK